VRIQHHIHRLVGSQSSKRQHEKDELGELNTRLDKLVEAIKVKKSQNDALEATIRRERDAMLSASGTRGLREHVNALDAAKQQLNEVSEQSSVAKIRASRSLHDLHAVRISLDDESRHENARRERITALDAQRARSSHELTHLRASWQSVEHSLDEEARRVAQLRAQLDELNNRLDAEQEARLHLEHRIQTMHEAKKFDEEMNAVVIDELKRMAAAGGSGVSSAKFFADELADIKRRIREDFMVWLFSIMPKSSSSAYSSVLHAEVPRKL
jgi:chromosome segregation ATPase